MLGTAEGSDVLAHLLGLAVGVPLGLATARAFARPPGAQVQVWLVATALLAIAFCWSLALPS